MSNTTFNPKKLAKQTIDEIQAGIQRREKGQEENILDALQDHYTTLERNQRMYIEYLTEFIEKMKQSQHKGTESLAQLKKEVLKHIIRNEKARSEENEN
jgi:hypothetical protein